MLKKIFNLVYLFRETGSFELHCYFCIRNHDASKKLVLHKFAILFMRQMA